MLKRPSLPILSNFFYSECINCDNSFYDWFSDDYWIISTTLAQINVQWSLDHGSVKKYLEFWYMNTALIILRERRK